MTEGMPNGQLTIRPMQETDIPVVVDCIGRLLAELTGDPTTVAPSGAAQVCHRILLDGSSGAVFLAFAGVGEQAIGILALSVQDAIHVGGKYALIQDLWVDPTVRGLRVGEALIDQAVGYIVDRGLSLIEVGLPGTGFHNLVRTHHFYQRCGFTDVGPRMRKRVH